MRMGLLKEPWNTVGRAGLIAALVGGALMGAMRAGDVEMSPIPVTVLLVLALVSTVTANLQVWRKWRTLDEAAQRARMAGTFWGGSAAMSIAAFVAIFSLYGILRMDLAVPALSDNGALFGLGIVACLAAQSVGGIVGWAVWWLRASR